jgi:uncharacterized membrane protein YecN with MAPEG domain
MLVRYAAGCLRIGRNNMHAEITALYLALTSLLFLGLSYRVAAQRKQAKVGLGIGDDPVLEQAVRIQANLAEYAPVALLLMLVYELNGGAVWLLHLAGAVFVIGRVLHAQGLASSAGTSFGRIAGMMATWGVILILAAANVWKIL